MKQMKDLLKTICRLVISSMVWRVEKVCAGCALLILSFSMTVWSQQLMTDNAHWGEENLSYDVIYQWGFIWKKAASARLILKPIVINDVSCYMKCGLLGFLFWYLYLVIVGEACLCELLEACFCCAWWLLLV